MNKIRNTLLDYYLHTNIIVELHKKYQHNKIGGVLKKYSKDSPSIDQIVGEIEMYRNTKKSLPEENIAEKVKLIPQDKKRNKMETGIGFLTPNKLLTRLSVLLAQIKARKNSYKLKNEIRQILRYLYHHNKINKKRNNN